MEQERKGQDLLDRAERERAGKDETRHDMKGHEATGQAIQVQDETGQAMKGQDGTGQDMKRQYELRQERKLLDGTGEYRRTGRDAWVCNIVCMM